jgi:hypothetical protein
VQCKGIRDIAAFFLSPSGHPPLRNWESWRRLCLAAQGGSRFTWSRAPTPCSAFC